MFTASRTVQPTCKTPFCQLFGFNIGEKVRFEWDRQRPKIELMANNAMYKDLVEEMVNANPCVSDLEGYDALMELGTRYVEANSDKIEMFYMTTLSLKGEKNMTALFSKYADWFNQLDVIWSQISSFRCQDDPSVFAKAARDLGYVLYKMGLVEDIPNLQNDYTRENFFFSARVLQALANSADHFLKAMANVDCYSTKDAMVDWTELSAFAIDEFAEMMGAIGNYENAREIKVRATFVHSLAETLSHWPNKAPVAESCMGGRLARTSKYLQEISDVIAAKGLDYLSTYFGVNFRIDLIE